MSSTTSIIQARVGREKQRYDNYFRLVAGCIPYRLKIDVEKMSSNDFSDEFEVLMISTPNRHDLVFPKGGWEDDETVHEAACREALEEAGVRGILNGCGNSEARANRIVAAKLELVEATCSRWRSPSNLSPGRSRIPTTEDGSVLQKHGNYVDMTGCEKL